MLGGDFVRNNSVGLIRLRLRLRLAQSGIWVWLGRVEAGWVGQSLKDLGETFDLVRSGLVLVRYSTPPTAQVRSSPFTPRRT
jgi:hypothetical protein